MGRVRTVEDGGVEIKRKRLGRIIINRTLLEDILADLFPDCEIHSAWYDFDTGSFRISLEGPSMPEPITNRIMLTNLSKNVYKLNVIYPG